MNFVPIRVSTLRGDQKIPFDAYLKIDSKHILYCRKGDDFHGVRLEKLRSKKLKKMFISEDDEGPYRQYLNYNIEMAYSKTSGKPLEARAEIIQGVQQAAAEDVMEDPDSLELYKVALSGSSKYIDFILGEDRALKCILTIPNTDRSVSHHGVNVAALAVSVAHQLGLSKERKDMMSGFVLGCLLHDFELHQSGFNVGQRIAEMSETDLNEYKLHPERGVQRVKTIKHFDKIVLDIIFQHEELIDGSGFPQGLSDKNLDPLVLVCSTCNAFDRMMSLEGRPIKQAMKSFLIDRLGLHPLEMMKAVQDVLKAQELLV